MFKELVPVLRDRAVLLTVSAAEDGNHTVCRNRQACRAGETGACEDSQPLRLTDSGDHNHRTASRLGI
jgi:hypothetical protein